jgi:NAD dependent epimerase/dehydratase family enzyme
MKKIVISGASGFVGSALKNYFQQNNCEVTTINRVDFSNEETLTSKINNCDVLINLNGANIINRWSESYKKAFI